MGHFSWAFTWQLRVNLWLNCLSCVGICTFCFFFFCLCGCADGSWDYPSMPKSWHGSGIGADIKVFLGWLTITHLNILTLVIESISNCPKITLISMLTYPGKTKVHNYLRAKNKVIKCTIKWWCGNGTSTLGMWIVLVNISHSLIVEKLSTQLEKWSPLINAIIIKMSGRINEEKVCEFMIKWS